MTRPPFRSDPQPAASRGGFTLIEMLVSSALVTIIMLLFSQVFSLAASSITDQRSLARNAQQARAVSQVLRSDLEFRTYRQASDARPLDANSVMGAYNAAVESTTPSTATFERHAAQSAFQVDPTGIVPLAPGDTVDKRQAGYFYVSENDPFDDTDDVVQFTIQIDDLSKVEEGLETFYGGQSEPLPFPGGGDGVPDLAGDDSSFASAPAAPFDFGGYNAGPATNQPDNDDGFGPSATLAVPNGYLPAGPHVYSNNLTRSRAAEVAYFLRGSNLYRRTAMLRNGPDTGLQALANGQPRMGSSGLGDRYLSTGATIGGSSVGYSQPSGYEVIEAAGGNSFWTDQDLSATRLPVESQYNGIPNGVAGGGPSAYTWASGLWINSTLGLDNTLGRTNNPIALPWMRFGHYGYESAAIATSGSTLTDRLIGRPREYGTTTFAGATVPAFIGRFTHGETSDAVFDYPGLQTAPGTSGTEPMYGAVQVAVPNSAVGTPGQQRFQVRFDPGSGERDLLGTRDGADLVLSNVTSFDVEFWDDAQGQFVDLGRPPVAGQPSLWTKDRQTEWTVDGTGAPVAAPILDGLPGAGLRFYGPFGATDISRNNVFDTWHPDCDMTPALISGAVLPNGDGVADLPPYRNLQNDVETLYRAGSFNGVGNYTFNSGSNVPAFWQPFGTAAATYIPDGFNTAANLDTTNLTPSILGSVVFANPTIEPYVESVNRVPQASPPPGDDGLQAPRPRLPRVGAGYRNPPAPENGNAQSLVSYLQPGPAILFNGTVAFRCVGWSDDGDGIAEQGLQQPRWPTVPGERVRDGELVWEAFDNRIGLKKMRIIIRYNDAQSGNPRQVTLVHSFVD